MKTAAAHIRWWAKRVGRPRVVPANGELGIANREYVTNEDRSAVLDPEKLARVKDPPRRDGASPGGGVRASQEEAIKFAPAADDRGACIRLKARPPRAVGRGGAGAQRRAAATARRGAVLAGSGALIPPPAQLPATAQGLREPDAGRGPVPHARTSTRVCSWEVRGRSPAGRRRGGRAARRGASRQGRRRIDNRRAADRGRNGTLEARRGGGLSRGVTRLRRERR